MSKSPKTIATINFKGGVGKTTVTWCCGDIVSSFTDSEVLMFDLDAQMSLTQAIALNEDGFLFERFAKWYDTANRIGARTIFDALDQFCASGCAFYFPIGFDFIIQIPTSFISFHQVKDLYWMELEVFDREAMKDFIRRLLGKITNSRRVPQYDYVLFDCPPSFTLLLIVFCHVGDLVLIPVNPDFLCFEGNESYSHSLKMRIEPFRFQGLGVHE